MGHPRRLVGLLITLTGTGSLLALVLTSGTRLAGWELGPPALVIGLGMGTCFGTVYDVTIGDTDPREAGSAGGSLSAVQQLANALGAAAVTSVYFHAPGVGHATPMAAGLTVVATVTLLCCGLVWLMPRKVPARHH